LLVLTPVIVQTHVASNCSVGETRHCFARSIVGPWLKLTEVASVLEVRLEADRKSLAKAIFEASSPQRSPGGASVAERLLHSLRHTYGTRLGEGRADAFTIMKLMDHSSVTVSQRYVHPSPETLEGAVDRLQALNLKKDREALQEGTKLQLPATIAATPAEPASVSPVGP